MWIYRVNLDQNKILCCPLKIFTGKKYIMNFNKFVFNSNFYTIGSRSENASSSKCFLQDLFFKTLSLRLMHFEALDFEATT